MNFELDQDYFNRAGDKVRYVGKGISRLYFRVADGTLRDYLPGYTHDQDYEFDILGKWEITDDPDRVYVYQGKEYRYADDKFIAHYLEDIQKILIKPLEIKPGKIEYFEEFKCPYCQEVYPATANHTCTYPDQQHKKIHSRLHSRQEKAQEILDSMAHLKKIEPLEKWDTLSLKSKINELIADRNNKLDNK